MLRVTFFEDSRSRLSSFSAEGHASFADYGNDVVCAAASAILQAARLGLEVYAMAEPEVAQSSGRMRIRVNEAHREDAGVQAILSTAALSIEQIASQFPENITYARKSESKP